MMVVALAIPVAALATSPKVTGHGAITTWPGNNDGGVLYSQLDGANGDGTTAQNFEVAFDAFDNQLADDFVVPGGPGWLIREILLDGIYFNGAGPAVSVNIWIHGNAAGDLPTAAPIHTRLAQAYVDVTGLGDFVVTPSPALPCLAPGRYWLVVQINMDFGVGGQWGWGNRIPTSNAGAAWQNPGGGFGAGCLTWGRRGATCAIDPGAPDQLFELQGVVCETTPVEATTWGRIKATYPSSL
jgi:hypothetical protein